MSGSARSPVHKYLAAALVFGVLSLVILAAFDIGSQVGAIKKEQEIKSADYEASAKKQIRDKCLLIVPVEEQVECIRGAEKSARHSEREEQDLSAQKNMALWAFVMVLIAAVTTALSLAGVTLLAYTLRYTKHAAVAAEGMLREANNATEAARDGAREASRAANEAVEANRIAKQVGDAQTRPYLLVDTTKVQIAISRSGCLGNIGIQVPVKNYGNTPAYDPNVAINCWGHTAQGRLLEVYVWRAPLKRGREVKSMSIGPQGTHDGIWTNTVVDAALIPAGQSRKDFRMLPAGAQFSANDIFADEGSYPVSIHADILFSYLDMYGEQKATEFYRLDCVIKQKDEWFKAHLLKVPYDPQGANDIYPLA